MTLGPKVSGFAFSYFVSRPKIRGITDRLGIGKEIYPKLNFPFGRDTRQILQKHIKELIHNRNYLNRWGLRVFILNPN